VAISVRKLQVHERLSKRVSDAHSSPLIMPTLGPSLLFVAGLSLGIGAGVFIPRRDAAKPVAVGVPAALPSGTGAPYPPPPERAGEKTGMIQHPTAAGQVTLAGGFPGV
jgi:endonuclease G